MHDRDALLGPGLNADPRDTLTPMRSNPPGDPTELATLGRPRFQPTDASIDFPADRRRRPGPGHGLHPLRLAPLARPRRLGARVRAAPQRPRGLAAARRPRAARAGGCASPTSAPPTAPSSTASPSSRSSCAAARSSASARPPSRSATAPVATSGRRSRCRRASARMVGASTEMRRLYPLCERLAESNVPVVIEGETGTGKEVLAEALHEQGPRATGPFVVFDCTAVPSEPRRVGALRPRARRLHRRGRARARASSSRPTGARSSSTRSATSSCPLQPKLLRALERSEVRRVGGDRADQGRRARPRGDAARPRPRGAGGALPRRPLLPPRRGAHRAPAAAAAGRATCPCSRGTSGARSAATSEALPGRSAAALAGLRLARQRARAAQHHRAPAWRSASLLSAVPRRRRRRRASATAARSGDARAGGPSSRRILEHRICRSSSRGSAWSRSSSAATSSASSSGTTAASARPRPRPGIAKRYFQRIKSRARSRQWIAVVSSAPRPRGATGPSGAGARFARLDGTTARNLANDARAEGRRRVTGLERAGTKVALWGAMGQDHFPPRSLAATIAARSSPHARRTPGPHGFGATGASSGSGGDGDTGGGGGSSGGSGTSSGGLFGSSSSGGGSGTTRRTEASGRRCQLALRHGSRHRRLERRVLREGHRHLHDGRDRRLRASSARPTRTASARARRPPTGSPGSSRSSATSSCPGRASASASSAPATPRNYDSTRTASTTARARTSSTSGGGPRDGDELPDRARAARASPRRRRAARRTTSSTT